MANTMEFMKYSPGLFGECNLVSCERPGRRSFTGTCIGLKTGTGREIGQAEILQLLEP
jgi:hypothetical protein